MPTKLKEKLRPAIKELVSIGFIRDATEADRYSKSGHGEWRINFTKSDQPLIADNPLRGSKAERTENRLLIKELVDRGMTLVRACKLVEDSTIDHDSDRECFDAITIRSAPRHLVFGRKKHSTNNSNISPARGIGAIHPTFL